MKAVDIDLAGGPEDETETMAVTPGEKEADEEVKTEFPHFHVEREEPLDIPESGRMTIEYEMVFDNEDDSESEGYNYKIDVKRIVGIEGPAPAKAEKTEDALDRLATEQMAGKEPQNV